jgi:malate permease and related proteins
MDLSLARDVFTNNLVPILLSAGTGFAMGRILQPDIKTVSRLAFYVFSPCLIFESLVRASIAGSEFARLALFTGVVSAIVAALSVVTGRLLGVGRKVMASLVIASVLSNSGNYGLAANKFAFGEEALARALVCFVFATVITYTAGVLVASMGKRSVADAFRNLLTVPAFYALVAAALVRNAGWRVPLFVDRSVLLLSDAAIPIMLVLLGLQIAEVRAWPRGRVLLIGAATTLQLVVTPLVALLTASWLGFSGPTRQAAVLQVSMPAAVVTAVLAVEYDLDTPLVSGTVVMTTLLSPLTLTPIISYLLAS